MKELEILDKALNKAKKIIKDNKKIKLNSLIKKDIDVLIDKIEQNKSLVSAITTSLIKKIIDPNQDIRLHRTDFENGYSARSLDTNFTSPFFKKYFPKYANKESAFLTLATRERIKWNLTEGNNLKIRNKELKERFLNIFEQIESNKLKAEDYLLYLFFKLLELTSDDELILQKVEKNIKNVGNININIILEMLSSHFDLKYASRLPVIAIYSIYQTLFPLLKKYDNKHLVGLNVHTSSDKHSYGDIEIYNEDNTPYEIVEIKHNIALNKYLIFDIIKKIDNLKVNRYYLLTTYKNSFENVYEEKEINDLILQFKQNKGVDIIANGILTTLKYYLRFIDDYNLFLENYTKNLLIDSKNSTEIKSDHLKKWSDILLKYGINLE